MLNNLLYFSTSCANESAFNVTIKDTRFRGSFSFVLKDYLIRNFSGIYGLKLNIIPEGNYNDLIVVNFNGKKKTIKLHNLKDCSAFGIGKIIFKFIEKKA